MGRRSQLVAGCLLAVVVVLAITGAIGLAEPTQAGTQDRPTETRTPTPTPTPNATATPTPTPPPRTPTASPTPPPRTPTATPTPTPTATPTSTPTVTTAPTATSTLHPTAIPLTPTPVGIDDCMVIETAGTYQLTQDLTDRPEDVCLDIRADNVTVDGAGHTIDSDSSSSIAAIRVNAAPGTIPPALTNVAIRNVETTDWRRGVFVQYTESGVVSDVRTADAGWGVHVEESTAVTVAGVTSQTSGTGVGTGSSVRVASSSNVTVTDVDADPGGAGAYGVHAIDSQSLRVHDVTATDVESGVVVAGGSTVSIADADVDGQTGTGIGVALWDLTDATLSDTTINGTNRGVEVATGQDIHLDNVTTSNSQDQSFITAGTTNLTVREFRLGAASTPTTVDATGTQFQLIAVPSPPGDPPNRRNVSRFVRVDGYGTATVNVSYTTADLTAADVAETSLHPRVYDSGWSQPSGPTDLNTTADYVSVTLASPAGRIVAPMGDPATTPSPASGSGFGAAALLVALAASLVVLEARRRRS